MGDERIQETRRMMKRATRAGLTHLHLDDSVEDANIEFDSMSDGSGDDSDSEKENIPPAKLTPHRKEGKQKAKISRAIVPSVHLSYMAAAYNVHFAKYSEGRTCVTQLLPSKVWKKCYQHYKSKYPDSPFTQGTLQERLREALKEIKTGTANVDNAEKVELQSQVMLKKLKATVGHAKRNVLRHRQEIIDGKPLHYDSNEADTKIITENLAPTTPSNVTTPIVLDDEVTSGQNTKEGSVREGGTQAVKKTPTNKEMKKVQKPPLTKAQMLLNQSDSITALANSYARTSGKREALIELKHELNLERQKKIRLSNLHTVMEHGVIDNDTFKVKAKELLEL